MVLLLSHVSALESDRTYPDPEGDPVYVNQSFPIYANHITPLIEDPDHFLYSNHTLEHPAPEYPEYPEYPPPGYSPHNYYMVMSSASDFTDYGGGAERAITRCPRQNFPLFASVSGMYK